MDDLLFASVNLPELDRERATAEILAVYEKFWFWDDYRNTLMLPLMTRGKQACQTGAMNRRDGEFEWLPYVPATVTAWFDQHVFPWMGERTRIMALLTQSSYANHEHIDCEPSEVGTRQHKFRIVLQGRTDTLYYKTDSGDVHVPEVPGPFLMDGGWPHGMENSTDRLKLTIAAGSPWRGLDSYTNITPLMLRGQHNLPSDLQKYYRV